MNQNRLNIQKSKPPRRRVDGVLLLDKPRGISSSAALTKVRGMYRAQKGGHTGSLDPLASGLLPVCLGQAAKFSSFFLEGRKRYVATGVLGKVTSTCDAEGEILEEREVNDAISRLDEAVLAFTGKITQIPPLYSAIKVAGRPLYKYARSGKQVEVPSREVEIFDIKVLDRSAKDFTIEVYCSKGTYIRTLIADIGNYLGCGAFVSMLRRLEVEGLPKKELVTLERLQTLADSRDDPSDFAQMDALLLPVGEVMAWLPQMSLPQEMAIPLCQGMRQGKDFSNCVFDNCNSDFKGVMQLRCMGMFIGVGHIEHGMLIPDRMMSDPFGLIGD